MRVRSLSLTNFRNYRHLELSLPGGALLFVGENAQGKSNLLEALYLLATTRSVRATPSRGRFHARSATAGGSGYPRRPGLP